MDKQRGYDFIGVSASFVVHDGNGRILLQKRGPKARDEHGRWDIGGGAIEFGETVEEAVQREVHEELGCEVLDMEFLTAYDVHREHDGKKTHWIAIIYAVKVDPAEVVNNEPHKIEELKWFTSHDLPEPKHSQFDKSVPLAIKLGIIK